MFDIAIVGYGPVGATLANLLGRYGWRVVILEESAKIFPIPRAVHLDDEAQRILQAAGVLDLVQPSFGGYPPDRQYINAKGKIFFETRLNTRKPFGYQSNMYFHQPTFEAGLREGVASFPQIDVRLTSKVIGISQQESGVIIDVENTITGEKSRKEARYAIGCDGARSFVRKSLGIGFRDLKFEQPWLVTDFYLKPGLSRDDVGFPYAHQQFCDPEQPISFIPNGTKNHYRFEFMLPKGVTKDEAETEAYVHKMLGAVVDIGKIDIVRGAVYTFHSLIAKQWRLGRVFIAGDAAHQMPPFAGQGMCSGLRDVQNLSWKLDLVLRAVADATLLDSYEAERKPHVTRMTRGTMFLGNLVQTQNPLSGWLRDLLFQTIFKIPAIFGRVARFALRPPDLNTTLSGGTNVTVTGTYFPQPMVMAENNETLLDELLGNGFAVLGLRRDPAPYFAGLPNEFPICFIDVLSDTTITPCPINHSLQIYDQTGKLADWFSRHHADYVVLRPDRFVFGAYTTENISTASTDLSKRLHLINL